MDSGLPLTFVLNFFYDLNAFHDSSYMYEIKNHLVAMAETVFIVQQQNFFYDLNAFHALRIDNIKLLL
jgi:hypothetical protein